MNDEQEVPLRLSRDDLYELAWSKPMSELAKDFGISDVALAKRCKRLGVPVPGRGYWARVDSGQTPYRPKLPHREPRGGDQEALAVAPQGALPLGDEEAAQALKRADATWLADRVAFERLRESRIEVPEVTKSWDPAIRVHRDKLRAEAKEAIAARKAEERYEKLPEWRKRTESCEAGWKWRWMENRGQRLCDYHKPRVFRVSIGSLERALGIVNAIANAAKARAFTARDDEKAGRIILVGHNAEVHLRLTEQLEQKTRARIGYDGKQELERYKTPTGRLRITLQTGYREGPSFEDTGGARLESLLNRVFLGVYTLVVRYWEREREAEAFQQRFADNERRRVEAEKARQERERKAAVERHRRERLLAEAQRWAEARNIRAYVAHIQSVRASSADTSSETCAWAEAALALANDIDPSLIRLNMPDELD